MNGSIFAPVFVLAVADWIAVARSRKSAEYFFKPAVMGALIVTAFQIGSDAPDRQLFATIAALAFSLIGDVFLMLPRDLFLQGLSAFFVAHVCYVIALLHWPFDHKTWAVAVSLVVVAVPLFRLLRRGMIARHQTKMIGPVLVYCVAISAMVVAAASFARLAALAGALLFYSSDLMIGIDRFVDRFKWASVAIIVTYHLGQIGLVAALVR